MMSFLLTCFLGLVTKSLAYNDYPFCREQFFDLVENGAETAGFSNATTQTAVAVVEIVCSCDIPDNANSASIFWADMINGTQSQDCDDVLVGLADSGDAFTTCNVTEGSLDELYAECPYLLYDLLPTDLYPYFANAAEEITDCVQNDTMANFLDELCDEDDWVPEFSFSFSYSYSLHYSISYSWEYSMSYSFSFYDYDPTTCAGRLMEVVRVMQGRSGVNKLRESSCNLNPDDVLNDDDDEIVPDDLLVDDGEAPSPAPSPRPTVTPTSEDTTTLAMTLSMSASTSPTDNDKTVLKAQVLNQTSLSSENIKNFEVTYTAASRRRLSSVRKLLAGTWDVTFDVVVSLSSQGTSSASALQTTMVSSLQQTSFTSKVKKNVPSVTSVDNVDSVIQTRNPSLAPTPSPKKSSSSDASAASLQFILIGAGGFLAILIGVGVGFKQYQKKQKYDLSEHIEKDNKINELLEENQMLKEQELVQSNIVTASIVEPVLLQAAPVTSDKSYEKEEPAVTNLIDEKQPAVDDVEVGTKAVELEVEAVEDVTVEADNEAVTKSDTPLQAEPEPEKVESEVIEVKPEAEVETNKDVKNEGEKPKKKNESPKKTKGTGKGKGKGVKAVAKKTGKGVRGTAL